ncbi:MAG: exodeoxyribonuclease VII large subunit [Lachnospiraceae bacterium]|nr:exodeoxyribonuclease VII large subunit [Lachnospiraceae bacterium]
MQNVYSVSQVNHYIKNMFTQDFMLQAISVQGEASNVKYHSSGHIYFTLKDEKGTLACVMFAGNRSGLAFRMEEGQKLIVSGTVDVYERDGKYQLYARCIELSGGGELYEKFEKLKAELLEMGMFDAGYKQPIPRYIRTLGVVTAPTGAAVRDIIRITQRRNPYVQIVLFPAVVQGENAAPSIVQGIYALEQYGVDTIIVGRGGGSLEDLWAFNERIVAEAIFNCSVPIISAVGHETDTTIADLVADLRASTPSAAAELAVFDYDQFIENCRHYSKRCLRTMKSRIELSQSRLDKYRLMLEHKSPMGRVKEQKMHALSIEERMEAAMQSRLLDARHRMELCAQRLHGLSPLGKLKGGYGYVQTADGRSLTDIGQVKAGDLVTVHLENGRLTASVLETEPEQWENGGERLPYNAEANHSEG